MGAKTPEVTQEMAKAEWWLTPATLAPEELRQKDTNEGDTARPCFNPTTIKKKKWAIAKLAL